MMKKVVGNSSQDFRQNKVSTLILNWGKLSSSFDLTARVWENSHANSCFSTLINFLQPLFLFDQDMRVEKALSQTLICQLSCNSCCLLTRAWELRELSYKLLLVNSRVLVKWEQELLESWEARVCHCFEKTLIKTLAFQILINSHATLVLVWPGHESWQSSHIQTLASCLGLIGILTLTKQNLMM